MSFRKFLAERLPVVPALIALLAAAPAGAQSAQPLDIDEAVEIALAAEDPTITAIEERAAALDERAIADAQLADPTVRVGMMNWPTDTFRYVQEPMTKLEVGVQQAFPKGKTLKYRREMRSAEAEAERAARLARALEIERAVRRAWLDLWYWSRARGVLVESRDAVAELVEVIRSFYATGRQSRQDALRSELELSLLDDRLVEAERQIAGARADLARYIGAGNAGREAAGSAPPDMHFGALATLAENLPAHPVVQMQDARIDVRDSQIGIARQAYKPGWSVEAAYGARGGDRADLATLMVRFDVPLFTGKRQDRRLAAARRDRQSAHFDREARILELTQGLERAYADHQRLAERIALFETTVLERASENTEAALDGYRNKTSDFAELIRSRLSELNLQLSLLKVRADKARAEADLMYYRGDL